MEKRVEVICATMNQNDFTKFYEMNIKNCDVVFANQCGKDEYIEETIDGNNVKMISSSTVGVGKNRNIGNSKATGEILLFADDDMVYVDNMAEIVSNAFVECGNPDFIVFGTKYSKNGQIYRTRLPETAKLKFRKSLKYGTYSIAIKREAMIKNNLVFTELLGGGCPYSYGEDTDFILQCFRKKLKMYSYHAIIGTTKKDTSTVFSGYGRKFYYDKGALARHSFGCLAVPYMFYMANKKYESELSLATKLKCLFAGYRSFKSLKTFDEWEEEQ